MKTTLPIGEAKPQLCGLVEQARKGHTSVITVNNEPAAQLMPVESPARKLTEEWRKRRKSILLNRPGQERLTISELIRETRK